MELRIDDPFIGSKDLICRIFGLPLNGDARQNGNVIRQSLAAYSSFLKVSKGLAQKEKFDAFEKKTVHCLHLKDWDRQFIR